MWSRNPLFPRKITGRQRGFTTTHDGDPIGGRCGLTTCRICVKILTLERHDWVTAERPGGGILPRSTEVTGLPSFFHFSLLIPPNFQSLRGCGLTGESKYGCVTPKKLSPNTVTH
jgi:hypothetical protein